MTPFKRFPNERIDVIYHDKDEITWMGSSSGIYSFNNRYFKKYHRPYPTLIRKVTIGSDSVIFYGTNYQTIDGSRVITLYQPEEIDPVLSYEYNDIAFSYAAPFFEKEKDTEFKYRLKGFKNDWSNWEKGRQIVFTNLREGKYTFYVMAKNIYNIESTIASFNFAISPPWYRTIWAYILYVIIGLIVIYRIFKKS
jgi:hypothetical protein